MLSSKFTFNKAKGTVDTPDGMHTVAPDNKLVWALANQVDVLRDGYTDLLGAMNNFGCNHIDRPNEVAWDHARPFGKLTLADDVYSTTTDSHAWHMINFIGEPSGFYTESQQASLFQTTFAFEALSGGILTTLPASWDAAELNRAKRTEILILGDRKAGIATSLTPQQRGEVAGAIQGINGMAAAFTEMADAAQKGNEAELYDAGIRGAHETAMICRTLRSFTDKFSAPVKTLLFEPDQRPALMYALCDELYEHFEHNYEKATEVFHKAMSMCWDLDRAGRAKFEDPAVPIHVRVRDIERLWREKRVPLKRERADDEQQPSKATRRA